jgi:hypothetical protein
MTMKELRDGLNVLLKYGDGAVCADHDVIYAGPNDITPEDLGDFDGNRLDDLGWTWDTKHECWRHYC